MKHNSFFKSFIKTYIALILLLPHLVMAYPQGCENNGYGFDDPYVIFNEEDKQSFYLIQNHAQLPITFERVETDDAFMSPKLESKLNPTRWSAFAADVKDLQFQCISLNNGEPMRVNCREFLDICQYPRVKFALSNMGTYWVSTNKSQKQVIHESIKKGILLRW